MKYSIYVCVLLGLLFIGSAVAAESQEAPAVHFRFDGNFENEGQSKAHFEHRNTEFKKNALYLNGIYEHSRGDRPYRAVCSTPTISPAAFTVVLRFAAEEFSPGKTNVLTGGTSHRWFGMNRSNDGNLVVTLNNQSFSHEFANAPLPVQRWLVVACAVDIPNRKVVVYLNGKKVGEHVLPDDFELRVLDEREGHDRKWSFANYSQGNVFQGLIDELILFDGVVGSEELEKIPLLSRPDSKASTPVMPPKSSPAGFAGNWKNDHPQGGLTRVAIERNGNDWTIQAWGECEPEDCDWGKVPLETLGNGVSDTSVIYGLARWEKDFADTTMTLRIEQGALVAEMYTVFKDGSSRANYHSLAKLRTQSTDEPPKRLGKKAGTKEVNDLVVAFAASDARGVRAAANQLEKMLRKKDASSEQIAHELLERKATFFADDEVSQLFDEIVAADKRVLAAELLLRVAHARSTVQNYKRGHVVVGQLIVDDGKTDPELVMAQMPILAEGYFAGEVGDLKRPICFRSHGYQNLDVPLEGKDGDVVNVGKITLRPLTSGQQASLHGKLTLDAAEGVESAGLTISVNVGPINTPHNGYSPRRRWPEGVAVPVSTTGEFSVMGLSPCKYRLRATAKDHVDLSKTLRFEPGQDLEVGTYRLFSSDLGFYVGAPAPGSQELVWEEDYATALARAQSEKKPLFVMMTATWCGPCKLLEKETLSDPWIRHFLSQFIMVKAYEDKSVEQTYGLRGYPTLVFANSEGKLAYKSVGYKATLPFSAECAKAFKRLDLKLPTELETLVEKKVVVVD